MDLTKRVAESSSPSKSFGSFNSYDVTNDVFNRLVENGHEETISNRDFHNHLDSHFNRLPARLKLPYIGNDAYGPIPCDELALPLEAQKRFMDGEIILNAALDQTGKWDQGELLCTKAKLQIAQGQFKSAVETYTQLLAILHVQSESFRSGKKLHKDHGYSSRSFEQEIWHDLAYPYISLSQWRDAEICLSKSKAISSYSAVRIHATGDDG